MSKRCDYTFGLFAVFVWGLALLLLWLIFMAPRAWGQPSAPMNVRRVVVTPVWETTRIEAETGTWDGGLGQAGSGEFTLASSGTLFFTFTVPTDGPYSLSVRARGSIHTGEWPLMSIVVNGVQTREIAVNRMTHSLYLFDITLVAGDNQIGLGFYNDAYTPNAEDRNLYVDWIELQQ